MVNSSKSSASFPHWRLAADRGSAAAAAPNVAAVVTVLSSSGSSEPPDDGTTDQLNAVSSCECELGYQVPSSVKNTPSIVDEAATKASRLSSRRAGACVDGDADSFVGTKFPNNWTHCTEENFPATTSEGSDAASSGQRMPDYPTSSIVRELVVKFSSDESHEQQQQQQPLKTPSSLSSRRWPRFPAWLSGGQDAPPTDLQNASAATDTSPDLLTNASNQSASGNKQPQPQPQEQQTEAEHQQQQKTKPEDASDSSCLLQFSALRCLGLAGYYTALWVTVAGFTWLLLELCLLLTCRGKYPYYITKHSFFLTSPQLGYAFGNPEPGKVTEVADLSQLLAQLEEKLQAVGQLASDASDARQCDPAAGEGQAEDEATLRRPCNLTGFATAAVEKARELLKDRPGFVVQIRRHIGYLPASGNSLGVQCNCTADGAALGLRYHSWVGGRITESGGSGSIPTAYFPMLTRLHHAPAVLVTIDAKVANEDWLNKRLVIRCSVIDGGTTSQERELLLLVKNS